MGTFIYSANAQINLCILLAGMTVGKREKVRLHFHPSAN